MSTRCASTTLRCLQPRRPELLNAITACIKTIQSLESTEPLKAANKGRALSCKLNLTLLPAPFPCFPLTPCGFISPRPPPFPPTPQKTQRELLPGSRGQVCRRFPPQAGASCAANIYFQGSTQPIQSQLLFLWSTCPFPLLAFPAYTNPTGFQAKNHLSFLGFRACHAASPN